MHILVCVDVEGVSGIADHRQLDDEGFDATRGLVTADLNAALRGIRRALPDANIDVFDAHGAGGNLDEAGIDGPVRVLGGGWMTTLRRLVASGGLRGYGAAVLLGQHAAGGTRDGFMSHTNTLFAALRVHGNNAGEAPQLAWLFGAFGVPIALIVGDIAVERETRALLPGVETVSTKVSGAHRGLAVCLPVAQAHAAIEAAAERACRRIPALHPCLVPEPVEVEIAYVSERMAEMAAEFPGFERSHARSVRYAAKNYLEAWSAWNTSRVVGEAGAKAELLADMASLEAVQAGYKDFVARLTRAWLEEDPPFPAT